MKNHILPALKLTMLTAIVFGVLYPLFITGIAYVVAPNSGKGKTITKDGKIIGFERIGQSFTSDRYFNSRPSAVNYNAAGAGGSNKSLSNPEYVKVLEQRVQHFQTKNPDVPKEKIPFDLLTASGGGLDPDISPEGALVQIARISKARNISEEQLKKLVAAHTDHPIVGMAPATVNVLQLNVALDQLK